MSNLLQTLLLAGEIPAWIRPGSGCVHDYSENGNDGTLSAGVFWEKSRLRFPANTDEVTIADVAALRLTTGTIIALGDFRSMTDTEYVASHDNAGAGFSLGLGIRGLLFTGDGVARVIATNLLHVKCIGATFASGATPIGYVDGLSVGNFSGAVTVTATAVATEIGNWANSGRCISPLGDVIFISRVLTATEMAQAYDELENFEWPNKFYAYAKRTQAINQAEPGIVSGWDMKPAGGVIPDIAGTGDGTIVGAPMPEQGILGNRLLFDGVADYINCGNVGTIKSVAFWTKPVKAREDFLDLDGGTHTVEVVAGTITATGWAAPTIYVDGIAGTTLAAGVRQRIVVSTATGFAASAVHLGEETSFLEGTMGKPEFFST